MLRNEARYSSWEVLRDDVVRPTTSRQRLANIVEDNPLAALLNVASERYRNQTEQRSRRGRKATTASRRSKGSTSD